MRCNGLQIVEVKKDLGVVISSDLKCSQQCMYAYTKANRFMGMTRRMISYKEHRIMLVSIRHCLDHMLSIVLVLGIRSKDKELL